MIRLGSIFLLFSLMSGVAVFASDDQYFVRHGSKSNNMGPYSESELRMRLRNGLIKPTDYVWSASIKKWTQISRSLFADRAPANDEPPPFSDDEKNTTSEAPQSSQPPKVSGYVTPLIGFAAGTSNVTGGPYFTWGGEIGAHIKNWNLGLFGHTLSNSATVSGNVLSSSLTSLMLSATYSYGDYFYFGGRFGLAFVGVTDNTNGNSLSGAGFAFGPVVGARVPVSKGISATIDVTWENVSSVTVLGTTGTATLPSFSYLMPLAGVKIDF